MAQVPSAVRLPSGFDDFEDFAQEILTDWKVPGMGLSVVVDGEVVLSRGYGYRDVEGQLEVTPNTLFPIASATKAFTTMSLAVLADEGKVDWDTPIREYLPSFRLYDPVATERMTPRDLATHRSGLPRHDLMWYRSTASRRELFLRLRYLQPSADFRTIAQYQNLMYMTAGYLAGEIAGSSWEDLVQQRIFLPLGMHSSMFTGPQVGTVIDRALPYKRNKEKDVAELIPFYEVSQDLEADDALGPAGSICSTLHDMTQWLLLQVNGGKHGDVQVVSKAQLDQMHSPQIVFPSLLGSFPETPHTSYGMGWFVEPYRGATVIHHGGNIDGFTTLVTFMPDRKAGAVILLNMNGSPVREILSGNIYDRLLGLDQVPWSARLHKIWDELESATDRGKENTQANRVPNAPPSHDLDSYTGEFQHPGYGHLTITRDGEKLKAEYNTMTFRLEHYHYDIFEMSYEPFEMQMKVTFLTNTKGDIDRVTIPFESHVKDIVFTRVPSSELTDRTFLEQFCGEYELLESTMAVTLKGDSTLLVLIPGQPEIELEPYRGTEFVSREISDLSVRFVQDENGVVQEATITLMGGLFTARRKPVQS